MRNRGIHRQARRDARCLSRGCTGLSTGATTRRASPSCTAAGCRSPRRPAGSQDLRDKLDAKHDQGHDRHRPHPLGHPRRAERRQRAPAHRRAAPHRRGAQRHHRERRARSATSSPPRACRFVTDTDTEALAHMIAAELGERRRRDARRGRHPRRCAASRAPTALSSSTRSTPTSWSSPATARRSCSASARARCSSPPTSPRSSATPARSSTWRTARSRRSRRPTTTRGR